MQNGSVFMTATGAAIPYRADVPKRVKHDDAPRFAEPASLIRRTLHASVDDDELVRRSGTPRLRAETRPRGRAASLQARAALAADTRRSRDRGSSRGSGATARTRGLTRTARARRVCVPSPEAIAIQSPPQSAATAVSCNVMVSATSSCSVRMSTATSCTDVAVVVLRSSVPVRTSTSARTYSPPRIRLRFMNACARSGLASAGDGHATRVPGAPAAPERACRRGRPGSGTPLRRSRWPATAASRRGRQKMPNSAAATRPSSTRGAAPCATAQHASSHGRRL